MLVDRSSESFSLFAISKCQFVSSTSNTQGLSRNSNTSSREGFHGKLEPKAILSESVFLGNLYILKHQCMGIASANSQLIFLCSKLKSFHFSLNDQAVDSSMAFLHISLGNH